MKVDNDYRKEERDFPWLRKLTVRVFNREIEMSHGRSVKVKHFIALYVLSHTLPKFG